MIVSLNEVETACQRAALGAGLGHGLAEEAAAAGGFLARHCPGAVALIAATFRTAGQLPTLVFAQQDRRWRAGKVSALAAGPAVADLFAAGLADTIHLEGCDQPLLLAAYLAARGGIVARLEAPGWGSVTVGDGVWQPQAPCDPCQDSVAVRIQRDSFQIEPVPRLATAILAEESDWRTLLALMRLSYVPSTAQSAAQGAGAGRIDND